MSFRFRKNKVFSPPLQSVSTLMEKSTVRPDGLTSVSVVRVNACDIDVVPPYTDYTLEKLLAAGVPLSSVNSTVLDSEPTTEQAAAIVESLN